MRKISNWEFLGPPHAQYKCELYNKTKSSKLDLGLTKNLSYLLGHRNWMCLDPHNCEQSKSVSLTWAVWAKWAVP